ncbi:hypothetical protein BURMUCGD2M_3952 [Burkholderia multivorans CGD2M]|uniref:Uncharacterized protein n=1 Tax=Burkholderia multivorans CGD2 TaxID=513052 RepID=B9BRE7_9BURK|nr:hypothetical protein BURMUCGD2_3964 [Burkholderia multivorans CGD2]EEE11988.1 hypothetical protein BURMUCGD2M_3952 [Burkholderia multivorans CGD2M]
MRRFLSFAQIGQYADSLTLLRKFRTVSRGVVVGVNSFFE